MSADDVKLAEVLKFSGVHGEESCAVVLPNGSRPVEYVQEHHAKAIANQWNEAAEAWHRKRVEALEENYEAMKADRDNLHAQVLRYEREREALAACRKEAPKGYCKEANCEGH